VFSRSVSRSLRFAWAAGATAVFAVGCSASQHAAVAQHTAVTTTTGTASNPSPRQVIELAAAHARLATSYSATFSMSMTGTSAMTMQGTLSAATSPALFVEASFPDVSYSGQSIAGGVTEIVTAKALYMKMTSLSQSTGKPWLEIPFSTLNGVDGATLSQLFQQVQSDSPLLQTQMLASAADVRKVGAGVVNGVAATEYTGSYSIAAGLARLPASSRKTFQQQLAKAGIIVTEHGSTESIALTEVVTSVNQPVSAQLPPASETSSSPKSALSSGQQ